MRYVKIRDVSIRSHIVISAAYIRSVIKTLRRKMHAKGLKFLAWVKLLRAYGGCLGTKSR